MKPSALVAVVLLMAVPAQGQAQDFAGVGRAIDGDSLFVAGREVRLFGIDAPEYRQTCRVGWSNWSCGADAASALRAMVDGQHLMCTSVDRDVYGRTVADCRIDGADVAAAMLDKGLAIALDNASADYRTLQAQSKARQAGIWASEFETPKAYRTAHPRVANPQAFPAPVRALARPVAGAKVVSAVFRNCAEARAAGAAPVRVGQPGYGPHLDRDGDGIGCKPYRGRR